MLDIHLDEDFDANVDVICDGCGGEAYIFQEEGNFCLNCWQVRTEPEI